MSSFGTSSGRFGGWKTYTVLAVVAIAAAVWGLNRWNNGASLQTADSSAPVAVANLEGISGDEFVRKLEALGEKLANDRNDIVTTVNKQTNKLTTHDERISAAFDQLKATVEDTAKIKAGLEALERKYNANEVKLDKISSELREELTKQAGILAQFNPVGMANAQGAATPPARVNTPTNQNVCRAAYQQNQTAVWNRCPASIRLQLIREDEKCGSNWLRTVHREHLEVALIDVTVEQMRGLNQSDCQRLARAIEKSSDVASADQPTTTGRVAREPSPRAPETDDDEDQTAAMGYGRGQQGRDGQGRRGSPKCANGAEFDPEQGMCFRPRQLDARQKAILSECQTQIETRVVRRGDRMVQQQRCAPSR